MQYFILLLLVYTSFSTPQLPVVHYHTHKDTINNNYNNLTSANSALTTVQQEACAEIVEPIEPPCLKSWKPTLAFVAGGLAVSGIGSLWLVYIWYHYGLYSKKNWSTWYEHKTLQELYGFNLEDIKKEFIEALRKRYAPFSLRPHLGHTLFNFEKDIIEEITMINNYLNFHDFMKRSYLYLILPSQAKIQAKALQNLQRLDFLQHLANSVSASLVDA